MLYVPTAYFNSRPHGGRQLAKMHNNYFGLISTHALTEGDDLENSGVAEGCTFQLTPSRRATVEEAMPVIAWKHISTHALTEGDVPTGKSTGRNGPFQLTPSRRATFKQTKSLSLLLFQLTPSRRATFVDRLRHVGLRFQLTPSRRATFSP